MDSLDSLQEESQELKVFLADIAPKNLPKEILEDRMNELENLVETFWWIVILTKLQKKDQPDTKTYIWPWKLEEITREMIRSWANLLIIWNALKPGQIFEINEFTLFVFFLFEILFFNLLNSFLYEF